MITICWKSVEKWRLNLIEKMDVRTRQESDPASDWNKVKMESRSPSKGLKPTSLILDSSSAQYFVEVWKYQYCGSKYMEFDPIWIQIQGFVINWTN